MEQHTKSQREIVPHAANTDSRYSSLDHVTDLFDLERMTILYIADEDVLVPPTTAKVDMATVLVGTSALPRMDDTGILDRALKSKPNAPRHCHMKETVRRRMARTP